MINVRLITILLAAGALVVATSCEKHTPPTPAPKTAEKTAKADPHDCGDEHDHEHAEVIELGTTKSGGFDVKAARDKKIFKGGCDSPVDVWVTGGTAKVSAVRFWIGLEDAKASLKSKAEIEKPAEPDHYHTHVEIPNPIPAGSKLWVEIEAIGGAKSTCSFDLRT